MGVYLYHKTKEDENMVGTTKALKQAMTNALQRGDLATAKQVYKILNTHGVYTLTNAQRLMWQKLEGTLQAVVDEL